MDVENLFFEFSEETDKEDKIFVLIIYDIKKILKELSLRSIYLDMVIVFRNLLLKQR